MKFLYKFFKTEDEKLLKKLSSLVEEVFSYEEKLKGLSDEELKEKSLNLKEKIQSEIKIEIDILNLKKLDELEYKEEEKKIIENILNNNLSIAFALVREASRRALGMMHYKVQVIGGIIMHRGYIAEMRTGEGKTLVATLPAYLNALSGRGVHIVTVNDYLSKRDAVWMGKIYDMLGLSVGILNHQVSYIYDREAIHNKSIEKEKLDDIEVKEIGNFKIENEFLKNVSRKEAYNADITYGTNNEFGFDYLRDNLVYESDQIVQRDHNFAIVDEVDSILIDESRTPLIISNEASESDELYKKFAKFVEKLEENIDYTKDEKQRAIQLKSSGIEKAEKEFNLTNFYAAENIKLIHHLETAVKAKALFIKEKQYVVKDIQKENGTIQKEVVIVDEFTGRMQPGRRWSDGLHQAIEAKENVAIQKESKTIASITFQNYFRFYKKLSGMSGTAKTNEEEFYKVYGLQVATIPTHNPIRRKDNSDSIFQTEKGKLKALTKKVKELNAKGQPVLIGTISIEKNELISKYLEREKIPHNVLNAKNHEKEGEIISAAGKKYSVTIATNLAGRGVDIKLGGPFASDAEKEEINNLGGLFVIGTERHEARRIDNQLRGRSGRQGDNGETQFFVSLEDDLMRIFGSDKIKNMMGKIGFPEDMPISSKIVSNAIENAQEKIEGFYFDARKHTLQYDDVLNSQRKAIYDRRRKIIISDDKNLKNIFENILEELKSRLESSNEEKERIENIENKNIDYNKNKLTKIEFDNFIKEKIEKYGESVFYNTLKNIYLQIIDQYFMAHLEHMDYIRSSVNLRAYGQRDPLVEYKKEGLLTYKAMQENIKNDFYNFIINIDSIIQNLESQRIIRESKIKNQNNISNNNDNNNVSNNLENNFTNQIDNKKKNNKKIGRNDICLCGSGKKVKKCDCKEFEYLRK